MRVFISTGEPSGDLHAANLVKALKRLDPDIEIVGFGGPQFAASGARMLFPLVNLAVMWFGRVLLNFHRFLAILSLADRCFRHLKPDVVVLIDYPGLHWWLAWRARVRKIPVVYYVPPQIWAWAGWRIRKVRKYIELVLCSLPFEPAWYHARGVPGADYVGHPYFDELAERTLDTTFLAEQKARGGPVVALLPGSRRQEILRNFPTMLRAAEAVARQRPDARFVVACLHERSRQFAQELAEDARAKGLALELFAHRTAELIRLADVAWAVSGSVGLELMVEALPAVVLYTIRPLDLWIARPFIKARFISIVNLLAGKELMPEYLTCDDVSPALTTWALGWLNDSAARQSASAALAALRDRVAVPGASDRAAARILSLISQGQARRSEARSHSHLAGPHRPSGSAAAASGTLRTAPPSDS